MDNSNKRISGLARGFVQYVNQLKKFTYDMYPQILGDLNDSSVGSWLIDLNASIGDNLSNYIDRAYNETTIDLAQQRRSLLAIARTKGLRIPGRAASLCEVEITANIPMNDMQMPDWNYAPIIRAGSQSMGGGGKFELMTDCDFNLQFDQNGISNRIILPNRDNNGNMIGYIIKKREIMSASETKIYQDIISDNNIMPFMEFYLPENNVLNIDSIIFKEGTDYTYVPEIADFNITDEFLTSPTDQKPTWRYFEVDSLLEDKLFLPEMDYSQYPQSFPTAQVNTQTFPATSGTGVTTQYSVSVVRGGWKTIRQKYVTEYTDNGFLKITFGAGSNYEIPVNLTAIQKTMSRTINNHNMGILPQSGWTMWIKYHIGGGEEVNVAPGVLKGFIYKDVFINGNSSDTENNFKKNQVTQSITVTNVSPSLGGKLEPTNDEIRQMIKYNNLSQNRCVTLKDYLNKIQKMPGIYGQPFRASAVEKNNIIHIYCLGIDSEGHITNNMSSCLIDNISNYLSEYKLITDYVVIGPADVIDLQVEVDIVISKSFSNNEVVRNVIDTIYNFFDVNKRELGENIYISQLQKEISNISGVANLIDSRIYNVYTGSYSVTRTSQSIIKGSYDESGVWHPLDDLGERAQLDLSSTDGIIFGGVNFQYQIRFKERDIKIRVKNI